MPCIGAAHAQSVHSLRLIGEQRIPHKHRYEGTIVGGLSGIDYHPAQQRWMLASDDRSDFNEARFYTATLDLDRHGFRQVTLTAVTPYRQPNGETIPWRWFGGHSLDAESIRFDPVDETLWISSEGDRGRGYDPAVLHVASSGDLLGSMPAATMFTAGQQDRGPRSNLSFEGLTFAADGQSLWVAMEGPLLEDGGVPTPASGALSRLTEYDRSGKVLRQVAYSIDPIPAEPGKGKLADNGVTEILAVDAARILVLERAAVQNEAGRFRNYVRLYEVDIREATDIRNSPSLRGVAVRPAAKRLVLDFSSLGLEKLDNIEGMAWGPILENGNRTLVLVSDDNFNGPQVTQLLAFEVTQSAPPD